MTIGIRTIAALLIALFAAGGIVAQTPGVVAPQGAKNFQQIQAQQLVHPIGPGIKQPPPVRRVTVPKLSSDGVIADFESRVREICRTPSFKVGRPTRKSSSPPGTLDGQDPPAGTVIACGQAVNVFVAVPPFAPPAQPEQPATPAQPVTPTAPSTPKSPWRMPDLSRDGAETALRADGARRCETFFVDDLRRTDARPRGTIIDQDPRPGTLLTCAARPSVTVSLGPPQAPRFVVPDLSAATTLLNFQSLVRSACGNGFAIARRDASSTQPAGEFIRQSPPVGTAIGCGAAVRAVYSSGPPRIVAGGPGERPPPLWQMPDMTVPGADARLDREARAHCGPSDRWSVSRTESPSDRPAGTLLLQIPVAGAALQCADVIRIVRAGPAAPDDEGGGGSGRSWWPAVLAIVAVALAGVAAWLWRALLHPRLVVGTVGLAAAPGDGWTGGPITRIALVSGGLVDATPPVPLPIAAVETADV